MVLRTVSRLAKNARLLRRGEKAIMEFLFWWAAIFGTLYFVIFSLVVPAA